MKRRKHWKEPKNGQYNEVTWIWKYEGGKPKRNNPHKSETVSLCQPCHSTVHATFSNKKLYEDLNTIESLKEALDKWIKWIEKKPHGYVRIKKKRSRR